MRDLGGVLVTAGRVFGRHWPALLTLACLAVAFRTAAVWGAVQVSDVNGQLAQLLLILAPLGILLALVSMLAICRTSLPGVQALEHRPSADTPTEERPRRLVDIAVSVLVPFLAVYQAYGLLQSDIDRFRNLTAYDEFSKISFTEDIDFDYAGRLGILSLKVALLVVLVAWVVRWGLGKLERATRLVALAFVGAFVELYYTSQLAGQTIVFRTAGMDWLRDRVAVQWFADAYDAVLDAVGFLGAPFDAVLGAARTVLSSAEAVVVVPVAYLAVAAIVLGYKLADEEGPATEATGQRRGFLRSLLADVKERFQPLVDGIRLLASAGLAPMLVFSLALVLVGRGQALVTSTARHVWGPMPTEHAIAVAPIESALGLAFSLALTVPLLAAAVEWLVVRRRQDRVREPAAPRSPAAPTTPAPA